MKRTFGRDGSIEIKDLTLIGALEAIVTDVRDLIRHIQAVGIERSDGAYDLAGFATNSTRRFHQIVLLCGTVPALFSVVDGEEQTSAQRASGVKIGRIRFGRDPSAFCDILGETLRAIMFAWSPEDRTNRVMPKSTLARLERLASSIDQEVIRLTRVEATDGALPPQPESSRGNRKTRMLELDIDKRVAMLDGKSHPLTEDQTRILGFLVDANGGWVSSTEAKKHRTSTERLDKAIRRLPRPIQNIIKSKRGAGSCLTIYGKHVEMNEQS